MPGTWTQEWIGGKPADVFQPADTPKPRFGLLHLHHAGLGTLSEQPVFVRWLDHFRLACICPRGGMSWWADRLCPSFDPHITPERHLLQHVLPHFEVRWGLRPGAVGLHGIGMGGQGALRLAFKYPRLFPAVAAISSAIDYHEWYGRGFVLDAMYDSKEECRQDTALLHVHPTEFPTHIFFCCDPTDLNWYRGNDRLHEKLTALGIPHQCDLKTEAGGHSWQYFNHMAERSIRFLVEGLLQESRRLL
ncbi:MAG: alpha/beta hydrolase-fold protein [Gemmataceae bacterium]|nr:alpha/beta hydrolase-fold protein [Gemmataceae bacterium]MDW8265926.1 alpha/beta hydrolase-fold protein [Gemmataceae bacterium]